VNQISFKNFPCATDYSNHILVRAPTWQYSSPNDQKQNISVLFHTTVQFSFVESRFRLPSPGSSHSYNNHKRNLQLIHKWTVTLIQNLKLLLKNSLLLFFLYRYDVSMMPDNESIHPWDLQPIPWGKHKIRFQPDQRRINHPSFSTWSLRQPMAKHKYSSKFI